MGLTQLNSPNTTNPRRTCTMEMKCQIFLSGFQKPKGNQEARL